MRFKKIIIENFRPYYGKNELDFNLKDDHNILIVLGDNGHGKTSLLKAITWVFYGSSPRERFGLFNREARKQQGTKAKVEIGFQHEGHNYRLIRYLTPSNYPVKSGTTIQEEVSLYRDSTCIDKDELVSKELNEILPLEASQFFFFDGERIIEYTDPENWEQIRQAIECVLGIPTIRRAVDDLKVVKSELDLDYSEHVEKGKESKELGAELTGHLKTYSELEADQLEAKEESRILLEKQRDLEVNFRQYSSMLEIMEECARLESDQKEIESNLEEFEAQKLEFSEGLYLAVLSGQLNALGSQLGKQRELMESEREAALKNLGRIEILEGLKNRSMCYCGRKLDQDSISMICDF